MQWEGVVGRIGFTFLPSWATLFAVVQPAVSPSPAAPLCWVFCLCPRELVGPAGLTAQVLGMCCRCGAWQAIRPLICQSSSYVLGIAQSADRAPWVWEARKWLCAWNARSQPALCRVSAQPAEPAALCLGGRSSCLGLESLGWAGPPWD